MHKIIFIILLLSGCSIRKNVSSVYKFFGFAPEYTIKNYHPIQLNSFNKKLHKVFIIKNLCNFTICDKIYTNVQNVLEVNNLKLTDKKDDADYIISIDVKNFAEMNKENAVSIKNYIMYTDLVPNFYFDSNNPKIISESDKLSFLKNKSALLSDANLTNGLLSMSAFTLSSLVAFAISGSSIVTAGISGIVAGGVTFAIIKGFEDRGYVYAIQINIKEKLNKEIPYNIKSVSKFSDNISSDSFYLLNSNYSDMVGQTVVIGIAPFIFHEEIKDYISNTISMSVCNMFSCTNPIN